MFLKHLFVEVLRLLFYTYNDDLSRILHSFEKFCMLLSYSVTSPLSCQSNRADFVCETTANRIHRKLIHSLVILFDTIMRDFKNDILH